MHNIIIKLYKTIFIIYITPITSHTLVRNKMFKLLNKVYIILSYPGRYVHVRPYMRSSGRLQIMCCNSIKNKCDCVYSCKKVEPIKAEKYIEELFKCEITNKPKRMGIEDCKCEFTCMVKKSETMIIHDNSNNDNK